MWLIYDLIFLLVALFYLPVYFFKGKFHRGFFMRLGLFPGGLNLNSPLWVHAVSVGEAMAVRHLIEGLRHLYPGRQIALSTVTPTGNKVAAGALSPGDFLFYLPLDFSFCVKAALKKIQPKILVIAETEIWPNLITCLYNKHIPIVVVNGRVSDGSFKGYLWLKFLFRPILNKVTLFCLQSENDAGRLIRLGVLPEKIKVTGNMKFDICDISDSKKEHMDSGLKVMQGEPGPLFVAGSTHRPEERIILSAYKKLTREFPSLKLLIAPRHPWRAAEVAALAERFGFRPLCISLMDLTNPWRHERQAVFILDTIGQLLSFYRLADIVFVGGSLARKGGHNMLEPAMWAKPILTGPFTFNFRDIAELFLENKAALLVHNEKDIVTGVTDLLCDCSQMSRMGRRASELIMQNKGASAANLMLLADCLGQEL
ncbi:MAG: 3-deoxy-D-manno-octulosonic acid transferase [Candidatus Omnitrophota bacterium]